MLITVLEVLRTEKKYEINSLLSAQKLKYALSAGLKADPHNGENGYMVRSLYFDSLFDDDYADKESGLERRKKIRLRVYDPNAQTAKLELKEKRGQSQLKRSLVIPKIQAQKLAAGDYSVLRETDSKLAREIFFLMQEGLYRPKAIVEYKRMAYTLTENDTRITIDSRLSATEASFDLFSKNLYLYPIMQGIVLEVKYNRFLLDYVKDLINFINKEETSVSKYILARKISRY